MIQSIFDDLLPPPRDLDAFVATHVLGWQGVRWACEHAVYVGKRPGDTVETPVPQLTMREDLVDEVQAGLSRLGFRVEATPVPEGWRVQIEEAVVTSRTLALTLCSTIWRALQKDSC